jgi:RNA recognition motif-containing protein
MAKKLIVSNFHPNTTEQDLVEMFEEYGLETVVLKAGKYAVLTFKDERGAEKAIEEKDQRVFWGYWLRLKPADR